ncbi:MAG: type II secretion system F family protein [Planctomycetaceae bacterium]|nr:type II secretion system F family protein [Planctomycetaceae bacterium]
MPDFQYIARELSGQQVTGVLSATSQQDALASLAARELFPVRVDLAEEAKSQQKYANRRVKPRVLSVFYGQLADLLKAGVPLLRSLELLQQQSTSPALSLVLEDVRGHVADGTPLFEAMKQHPRAFGELVVSMVRAGEEGGFLEDVLKRIAAFTDHQEDLKSRVLGALVYPVFLLVFGTIIVGVLLVYFVPKFEPIFDRMAQRGDLPWATTTLLGFSESAQQYWWMVVGVVVAVIVGLRHAAQTETGRWRLDTVRLRVAGFGRVVKSLAIARFCRILGTLLNNGVPILQSLRISKDATGNVVLARAIEEAAENVSEGKTLAKPLSQSGQFPTEIVEMISVGEEANNLENVLIDIADNLERRTNRELDVVVRMLEPLLLLVMAAVVLFVVIALLVPIMQSSSLM